jgi:uncharacterized protein
MSEGTTRSPAKVTIAYAIAVVLTAALLAPWVFLWIHPHLTGVPFRRVFDRVILIVALAGLWPLVREFGIRSWVELGFARTPTWWRQTLVGFALGLGSLAVAGGLLVGWELRSWAPPSTGIAGSLLTFAGIAVVVAVIEETFFRGGIQGALQRGMNVDWAVIVTSAIYSALHFLKPKGAGIPAEEVNWASGFVYLVQVFARSGQVPGVAVGFVSLWLAGGILGVAFVRTRALYLSMGIHAGWVFALKTFAWLTDANAKRTWWSGATLVENVIVWPVLVILLWLCWKKLRPLQP